MYRNLSRSDVPHLCQKPIQAMNITCTCTGTSPCQIYHTYIYRILSRS
jgi:hypothetical protein